LIWSSPTKFLLLRDTTNGPFLPPSSPARSSKWHIKFRVYDQLEPQALIISVILQCC
jgi:hypothetical protein